MSKDFSTSATAQEFITEGVWPSFWFTAEDCIRLAERRRQWLARWREQDHDPMPILREAHGL